LKVYETQQVPASTQEVCVRRRCDLCRTESNGSDWESGIYRVREDTDVGITVKYARNVWGYDGGGEVRKYEIDLCPACFRDRLVPWLKSEGAAIEESSVYY
jgi:hypothetical protein